MAITLKLDGEQLQALVNEGAALSQEIRTLSDNLAKWQAKQAQIIEEGLSKIVRVLGGTEDEETQNQIDNLSTQLDQVASEEEQVLNQPKT